MGKQGDLFGYTAPGPGKAGRPVRRFTIAEQHVMRSMLADGAALAAICAALGCSAPTLRRAFPAISFQALAVARRRRNLTAEELLTAEAMARAGATQTEIAARLGVGVKVLVGRCAGRPWWRFRRGRRRVRRHVDAVDRRGRCSFAEKGAADET